MVVALALNYRIDCTSQVTNTFITSAVLTEASGAAGAVSVVVQSVVHSAGGAGGDGAPTPDVSLAQQAAAIETTSRQVPTNRVNFVMCVVPSYAGNRRVCPAAIAVVN